MSPSWGVVSSVRYVDVQPMLAPRYDAYGWVFPVWTSFPWKALIFPLIILFKHALLAFRSLCMARVSPHRSNRHSNCSLLCPMILSWYWWWKQFHCVVNGKSTRRPICPWYLLLSKPITAMPLLVYFVLLCYLSTRKMNGIKYDFVLFPPPSLYMYIYRSFSAKSKIAIMFMSCYDRHHTTATNHRKQFRKQQQQQLFGHILYIFMGFHTWIRHG